jgi:hypothetical protein
VNSGRLVAVTARIKFLDQEMVGLSPRRNVKSSREPLALVEGGSTSGDGPAEKSTISVCCSLVLRRAAQPAHSINPIRLSCRSVRRRAAERVLNVPA